MDYAAACCHALCSLLLWTICLLFEACDIPQWFHVYCFSYSSTFADFQATALFRVSIEKPVKHHDTRHKTQHTTTHHNSNNTQQHTRETERDRERDSERRQIKTRRKTIDKTREEETRQDKRREDREIKRTREEKRGEYQERYDVLCVWLCGFDFACFFRFQNCHTLE